MGIQRTQFGCQWNYFIAFQTQYILGKLLQYHHLDQITIVAIKTQHNEFENKFMVYKSCAFKEANLAIEEW